MIFPYEERNTYSAFGYPITNEEPEVLSRTLGSRHYNKVASICSGGEIPILVLLPRTKLELVAVDHSINSLSHAYFKAALLKTYGPVITHELLTREFTPENRNGLLKAWEAIKGDVPDVLRRENSLSNSVNIRKEWGQTASVSILAKAYKNLGVLKFVHGDMTDIVDSAPFDCFYVSNAFGHNDRNGVRPSKEKVGALVKPGGHLLISCTTPSIDGPHTSWKSRKELVGYCRNGHNWRYVLCQTPKVKPQAPVEIKN